MLPFDQFKANMAQVEGLVALAEALDTKTTKAVKLDDVYRAAFVLGVSALDHYVHEKTLQGMAEIARGTRPGTEAFGRFRVTLAALGPQLSAPATSWIEQEVRTAHSILTFQKADAVADAVRLVHAGPLWPAVAGEVGSDPKTVKDTLNLIVDRRNKIAHEADCEPTGLGIKWPISASMVRDSLGFLTRIVRAIDRIV